MSDARDVQLVRARLKDAVRSNNKRHIAVDASDKEIPCDVRKDPPSGYTPLFPPAEVLDNAPNLKRKISYFLFVICYSISSLTRASLWQQPYLALVQRRHDRGPPHRRPLPKDQMRAGNHGGRTRGRNGELWDQAYDH
jgi:hypothetical protein